MQIIIGREYPDIITDLVKQSNQSIKILIYDWRWYENDIGSRIQKFNNEIIRARQRGVDITAYVNSECICVPLTQQKINVKKINSSRIMHIKMLIFDEKTVVVGSHNLSKNAFDLNHEMSVLFDDPVSVARCNDFFNSVQL